MNWEAIFIIGLLLTFVAIEPLREYVFFNQEVICNDFEKQGYEVEMRTHPVYHPDCYVNDGNEFVRASKFMRNLENG